MSRSRALALVAALAFYPFPFTLYPHSHAKVIDATLVSTATPEGRLTVFDDAWARINERYYDQHFRGLDWDVQRTAFRAQAAKADSEQGLYAVLRHMIASLNDPHTRVYAPNEKFDWWRPRFVSVGFAIAEIGGLPTVIKVDSGSAAQRAGVRAGDVIETVNGEAAMSIAGNRLSNLPELTPASARFRVFAKLLDGPADTSVDMTWKGEDGKRKSARFRRYWQQRELGVRVTRERGDYIVVDLDAFTKTIAADFGRSFREKLKGARGIILDLRNNGGGDAEAMSDIAATFLGVGVDLGQFTDRAGTRFSIFTQATSLLAINRLQQTKLPLIVLTSQRTASAAEIFVEALRTSRRATIIGAQTCGCVLAVRNRHLLPDGGLLDVSELDYQTAAGRRLEGDGIKPDEIVVVEQSDLYVGRDRAMNVALRKLARIATGRDEPKMTGHRTPIESPPRSSSRYLRIMV
ncbi:MAG TPA: S41 family peptidase [Pyrinomonadaceae bacterium]|nr:S41 family peptidase [Pyrinomonadaceae bacterium]